MIEVSVDLNVFGLDIDRREVSKIFIANVGVNPLGGYNYVYCIYEKESPFCQQVLTHGVVLNHDRNNACVKLVSKVLSDMGSTQTNMSEDFMERLKEEGKFQ